MSFTANKNESLEVFDFSSATDFLRKLVHAKLKRNSNLSLRAVAGRLGLGNISILLGLLNQTRKWNLSYCLRISKALNMTSEQREFFCLLVLYETARSAQEAEMYLRKIKIFREFAEGLAENTEPVSIFIGGKARVEFFGEISRIELYPQLREAFFDSSQGFQAENIFTAIPGAERRVKNEILGKEAARPIFSNQRVELGVSVRAGSAGYGQSDFFDVTYFRDSNPYVFMTGRDSYDPTCFTSQEVYRDPSSQAIIKIISVLGRYVSKDQYEDEMSRLLKSKSVPSHL